MRVVSSWLALLLAASGGCLPDTSGPFERRGESIVGGTADSSDAAVVGVMRAGQLICTGTVVDSIHVLTAAHCVVDELNAPAPPDRIFVCSSFLDERQSFDPRCFEQVEDAIAHPYFDAERFWLGADIAVLTLREPTSISPARLPSGHLRRSAVGHEVRVVGFGYSDGRADAGIKRQAQSPIVAIGPGELDGWSIEPDQLVMAGYPGTCNGDSGGPAFYASRKGEDLVGVTSYGDVDCEGAGVDTQVGSHICWLREAGVSLCAGKGEADPDGCGGTCGEGEPKA